MTAKRTVLVVPHVHREDARSVTQAALAGLDRDGLVARMLAADAAHFPGSPVEIYSATPDSAAHGCELILSFGGDGTILRAAELARGHRTPVLGVNLGHMGFLAESEPEDLPSLLTAVEARSFEVEQRMAIDITVNNPDGTTANGWALNDVSLEKSARQRMIEIVIAVDDQPLSRLGCDGVVCATPTGSTAYAWSAGGPVVWPDVDALLVVPISAHALFSRPLVISPASEIDVEIIPESADAVIWCDGRRMLDAPAGSRLEVVRSPEPVTFARLHKGTFSNRLVGKFALPVTGWRGRGQGES